MNRTIFDRLAFSVPTQREYTDEGFLKVPGRVARTGIQQYLASELGLTDRDPNSIVNVYRPPEEVFDQNSLDSYNAVDITIEHPKKMVDSESYRSVSGGVVSGPGYQDGDFVVSPLIIKDKAAIKAVESGKVQLSAGYSAIYDHNPGVAPCGTDYEFIQRNIRINHVALVDRARAGAQARLFDNHHKGKTMKRVTLDSGRTVELQDEATATLVQDTFDRLNHQIQTSDASLEEVRKKLEAKKEEADRKQAEYDAMKEELEEMKQKSSDSAISERLTAVKQVTGDALKVAGEDFTCDSVDPVEIKRAAMAKVRPNTDWADKSAVYVEAAFDMAIESPTDHQYRQLAQDGAKPNKPSPTTDARDKVNARLSGAWKKTAGEA